MMLICMWQIYMYVLHHFFFPDDDEVSVSHSIYHGEPYREWQADL